MPIYLNNKVIYPIKGEGKIINVYFGSKKVSGWKQIEKIGDTITWENSYAGEINGIIYGKSYQDGIPATDNMVPIYSAGGSEITSQNKNGNLNSSITIPVLRAIKVPTTATYYTYQDQNGEKWVADSLEYKGNGIWEHTRRIESVFLIGTSVSWDTFNTTSSTFYNYVYSSWYTNRFNGDVNSPLLSNYFSFNMTNAANIIKGHYQYGRVFFYLPVSINTKDVWVNWINEKNNENNSLEVHYILRENAVVKTQLSLGILKTYISGTYVTQHSDSKALLSLSAKAIDMG